MLPPTQRIDPADPTKQIPDDKLTVIDLTPLKPSLVTRIKSAVGAGHRGGRAQGARHAAGRQGRRRRLDQQGRHAGAGRQPRRGHRLGLHHRRHDRDGRRQGQGRRRRNSGPAHVVFAPDGKSALVTRDNDHRIAVLSIDGNKVERQQARDRRRPASQRPRHRAKGEVAVVANVGIGSGDADTISVIDLKLDPPRVVEHLHRRPDARGHQDVARRQVRRRHRHERHQQAAGLAVLQRQRHPAGVDPQRHAAHQDRPSCRSAMVPGRRLVRATARPCSCSAWSRRRSASSASPASPVSRCRRSGRSRPRAGLRASAQPSPRIGAARAMSEIEGAEIQPLHSADRRASPPRGSRRHGRHRLSRGPRRSAVRRRRADRARGQARVGAIACRGRSSWPAQADGWATCCSGCASRARRSPASRSTARASWASSTSRPTASPTAAATPTHGRRRRARAAARGGGRRHPRHRRRIRPAPAPSRSPSRRSAAASCPSSRRSPGAAARRISIDTRKAEVMRRAALAGAAHHQRRLGADARSRAAWTSPPRRGLPVVLMHAQGDPRTMQDNPTYDDVVLDVYDFLEARIAACERPASRARGSSSTPASASARRSPTTWRCWARLRLFHGLGCAVLLGASRKSFIGHTHRRRPLRDDRLPGSLAAALDGRRAGRADPARARCCRDPPGPGRVGGALPAAAGRPHVWAIPARTGARGDRAGPWLSSAGRQLV